MIWSNYQFYQLQDPPGPNRPLDPKAGGPESDVGTTSARAAESARSTSTTDFRGERDAREEYTSAWAANLAIGAMDMHQPKTGGIG